MIRRKEEIKELKRSGGHVYGFEGESHIQHGITRRNKLIDDLVVEIVAQTLNKSELRQL